MTARLLVKCDGPQCPKEIDSNIHAGTWLTLLQHDIFRPRNASTKKENKHFCSFHCLHNYIVWYINLNPPVFS